MGVANLVGKTESTVSMQHQRSLGNRYCSLAWLSLVALLAHSTVAFSDITSTSSDSNLIQRQLFLDAEKAFKERQFKTYKIIFESIDDDYPLKAFLEYEDLQRRLYLLPYADVDRFLEQQANTYLHDALARDWLEEIAKKKNWHDYRSYFLSSGLNSVKLQCLNLRARLYTSDETALDEVAALWNVGKSQPEECDPVFASWKNAGRLTPELAWDRLRKSIRARERTLARYIAKHMSPEQQKLANLYLDVDRNPKILNKLSRFSNPSPEMHEIILHGIRRYSRIDAEDALKQWERYDAKNYFATADRTETQEYLITQLAKQGHMATTEALIKSSNAKVSSDVTEWLIRDALSDLDWQRVYNSLARLSAEDQQDARWLYWRARAMDELSITDPDYPSSQQIYGSLALTRSFYGFLSSDILGQNYTLVDKPSNPTPEHMLSVHSNLSMRRASELLALDRGRQARREWFYATRHMEPKQLLAAGKIAEHWGWHRQSIQAMIQAKHWDDLQLRFPLAYQEELDLAAKSTQIEPTFLYAIARQESAFAPEVRSPAGAMGLMQLMPATAKQTANKIGVKYRYWDLIKPSNNIELGSSYLHQLLDQFKGNRILAAAAYNAGPNRVKQWISRQEKQIPYDVWIETIPFHETRGYVQNVLSFSVIYGYRLGDSTPLLSEQNKNQFLLGFSEIVK